MKIACVKTFYGNKEIQINKKKIYHASSACIPLSHREFMDKSLT